MSICWRRTRCRWAFLPSVLAITTTSIGWSAARRRVMSRLVSNCSLTGMNLSWLGLSWTSVATLGWDSMECVLHGASSHAGSIMTISKGLSVAVEQAMVCRTVFLVFADSCSGTSRHEPVHR